MAFNNVNHLPSFFFLLMGKCLIGVRNCLHYQIIHLSLISWQEVRGACGGWWYAPSSSPHYQGKGWEVYIYLAWTSLLLMVKRSLQPGCGALNAHALLVTYIFGATILLASAIISCGLLIPVFLLPLSFNRANSEQIYWPAVAWRLLGWNMFLNVSFTIYLKPYYL